MYFITTKRMLEVCFSVHPNIQYRTVFSFHGSCITIPVSQFLYHNPPPAIKLTELR